jgi:tetratricopeptide (TPR) repeat protein
MKSFKNILFLTILWITGGTLSAQTDSVTKSLDYFQNGSFNLAKTAIDAASVHAETSSDPYTWYVRGFIYKELYKKNERNNIESPLRKESIASFKKSLEMDSQKEHFDDNISNIKFMASTYYNDAVSTLTPEKYSSSINNFSSYKELISIIDPLADIKSKEIEFKLALASLYTSVYEKDKVKNDNYFNLTRDVYLQVLQYEPENISANYNLGILYYNKAVNIINEMDYDIDIFALMEMQDVTVEIFMQSLPYMEKAYSLDPKKMETLKGLEGIYFSLNEFDKSKEIKNQLEQLEKK